MAEFQRGSVIVCTACQVPIYALERGIGPSDRAGRAVSAFRPLTRADLTDVLRERPDLDPGWQLYVRQWLDTPASRAVFEAARPHTGDAPRCPNCGDPWCTIRDREYGTAIDKAYVWEMWDIPPVPGASRTDGRLAWRSLMHKPAHPIPEPRVTMKDGVPV